ncbi:NADH-quinone oxidoreductase subunit C [Aminirod propionatiphilus]|uniref:NADH-quinone oxidoreductase subunit C n=1 Tax=Aminirod propionatiphilus TaxID=3415223 RepID=A0ACD1DSN0_9BACT|nr:NADH-quinone oxidoreductase subunit C [Synergistota bacterium]
MTDPDLSGYAATASAPQDVLSRLEDLLGDDIEGSSLGGGEGRPRLLTVALPRRRFLEGVDCLGEFDRPHFMCLSGEDRGMSVLLRYDFALFRCAERGKRFHVTLEVSLPKGDLLMPSLQGRFPSAEYDEREVLEMLGPDFTGQSKRGRLFLPEGWEAVKPWRHEFEPSRSRQ